MILKNVTNRFRYCNTVANGMVPVVKPSPLPYSNTLYEYYKQNRTLTNETKSERVTINDLENGVKHVQLNRPSKLNSLDMQMFESIADAASKLREDSSIRAIILSGAGKAFCTGLDVKSMLDTSGGFITSKMERLLQRPSGYERKANVSNDETHSKNAAVGNLAQDVAYLWRDIPVPVIAVLHGMCFGGGMQIALGADFRFATHDCQLCIMESRWGLIPDMSASITLRELVRIDVAKELTMTGKIITGQEAEKLGLVTRCAQDPMEEATKLAFEIAKKSPDSVASTKKLYQNTWVSDESECLDVETKFQTKLLGSWNQIAAAGRNFDLKLPYKARKD